MGTFFRFVAVGFALWLVTAFSTGCGTIVHGSSQTVNISSEPAGAKISLNNGTVLTTPSSAKLKRNKDYIVTISKEGYQTQSIPLNSVLSGWLAGNIIFGGIIGGGVDLASGAAYTLTPENISISLTPLGQGEVAGSGITSMTTQQKLDALDRLLAQGVVNDKEHEASKAKLNEQLKKELMQGT